MEPPWEGVTKVYINGPGHMTKMVAKPIYGKRGRTGLVVRVLDSGSGDPGSILGRVGVLFP